LKEWTRERAPLDWARTQNRLGIALATLGERESGTARSKEAVAAFRGALGERTRERAPLQWARTQNSLGIALSQLGERESGTARLEEAVAAYRAALEEGTRERVPLEWAMTQNNLGAALWELGERESGTARLEEAVAAYRAALEERTRERAPLGWAMTQNNLGAALSQLGERESGTARQEEAVAAYRAALEERTRERVPLEWAATQMNLGAALVRLGEWGAFRAHPLPARRGLRPALPGHRPTTACRQSPGAVDEDEYSNCCTVGGQVAPGMSERHAGHHSENNDADSACRQRVNRRSHWNSGTEDRKSKKPYAEHQPGIADMQNEEQRLSPCPAPGPAGEPPRVDEGGDHQNHAGHSEIREHGPENKSRAKQGDRCFVNGGMSGRETHAVALEQPVTREARNDAAADH
jgi:hypothetical protein